MKLRRCRECGKVKTRDEFYGRSTMCKECAKDYQHNYYWKAHD